VRCRFQVREELEAACPSFTSVTPRELTDVSMVKDPDGTPGERWFEVATGSYGEAASVSESIEGTTVVWVNVHPTSGFAPYSLTETDSLGGGCVP
jgi:hypothetical protein